MKQLYNVGTATSSMKNLTVTKNMLSVCKRYDKYKKYSQPKKGSIVNIKIKHKKI